MLPDRSVLIGQNLWKMPKFKCEILSNFQTMCKADFFGIYYVTLIKNFQFTWMAFIWVDEVWMITLWRSQAIAPIQNEDMTMGKSWAALKNLQRISVSFPNGHFPATIDQKVTGHVKLQSKKSEKDKAKIKELRGSQRSWRSLRRAQSKQRLSVDPIIMTGM